MSYHLFVAGEAELDDAALALRIEQAGADTRAEAELFRRFAPRIRLYGLRHLRDEAAADDLVQDVIVLVLESLRNNRVREREQLASFVLGCCRMTALNLRRGERRRHAILLASPIAESHQPDLDGPLDLDRLRECLDQLPAREKTVAVLTFYGDRGADEIARDLEMTGGHVRVVRHRAVSRLEACMGLEPQP
jgi:RNA polymerase sigma-70 factor, ECF subfamily